MKRLRFALACLGAVTVVARVMASAALAGGNGAQTFTQHDKHITHARSHSSPEPPNRSVINLILHVMTAENDRRALVGTITRTWSAARSGDRGRLQVAFVKQRPHHCKCCQRGTPRSRRAVVVGVVKQQDVPRAGRAGKTLR